MLTILKALIVMVSFASMSAFAEPHVHGKAEAQVVVVGDQMSINVTIPGNTVAGFEYHPKSITEKKQLSQVLETLSSLEMVSFLESFWWKKKPVELEIIKTTVNFTSSNNQETENSTAEHPHHHDSNHEQTSSEHMEFVIKQEVQIQKGDALDFAHTQLFEKIPLLEALHIDLVIGNNQTHAILTKSEPMARLK